MRRNHLILSLAICLALLSGCNKPVVEETTVTEPVEQSKTEEVQNKEEDKPEPAVELEETKIGIKDIEASSCLNVKSKDNSTYLAGNVVDGNLSTAWVEGVDGVGDGQSLSIGFDKEYDISRLVIYGGFLKSQYRYTVNGKPTSIQISCGNGQVSVHDLELLDASDKEEPFTAPRGTEIVFDEPVHTDHIDIKILAAVGGTKYKDTAISEIEIYALLDPDELKAEKEKADEKKAEAESVIKAYKDYIDSNYNKEYGPVRMSLCFIDEDDIPEALIEQDGDIEIAILKIIDGKATWLHSCLSFYYKPHANDTFEIGGDGESEESARYRINGNKYQFVDGVGWYWDYYETGIDEIKYYKVIDDGRGFERGTPITETDYKAFRNDLGSYTEISYQTMFDSIERAAESIAFYAAISESNESGRTNRSDWKEALSKTFSENGRKGYSNQSLSRYYVYDIDKDGIPELILDFGEIEAYKCGIIFKYDIDKNEFTKVSDIETGHSSFYTYPNGNGVLFQIAGMGEQTVYRLSLQNNTINEEQIYYNYDESPDVEYTDVGNIVKGSEYMEGYDPSDTSGITNYK